MAKAATCSISSDCVSYSFYEDSVDDDGDDDGNEDDYCKVLKWATGSYDGGVAYVDL